MLFEESGVAVRRGRKFTGTINGQPFRGTIHEAADKIPGARVTAPNEITIGPIARGVVVASVVYTGRGRYREDPCATCGAKPGERCKNVGPGEAHFVSTIPLAAQPLSVGALKAGSR